MTLPQILDTLVLHEDYGYINVPETCPDIPHTDYYEALCYECHDSAEAGRYHIMMDGTVTEYYRTVDTSETGKTWRCDACCCMVWPNDENTEANIYIEMGNDL